MREGVGGRGRAWARSHLHGMHRAQLVAYPPTQPFENMRGELREPSRRRQCRLSLVYPHVIADLDHEGTRFGNQLDLAPAHVALLGKRGANEIGRAANGRAIHEREDLAAQTSDRDQRRVPARTSAAGGWGATAEAWALGGQQISGAGADSSERLRAYAHAASLGSSSTERIIASFPQVSPSVASLVACAATTSAWRSPPRKQMSNDLTNWLSVCSSSATSCQQRQR